MNFKSKQGFALVLLVALSFGIFSNYALARSDSMRIKTNAVETAHPALSGYDPVAYFENHRPMRGNGYHTATYLGETYLFATKEHKEMFESNPKKYVPEFGGYCAYGVAVGKKFYSDPERWKIVSGKLYLNLDKDIQAKWNQDVRGYIAKANTNWQDIKDKNPADL